MIRLIECVPVISTNFLYDANDDVDHHYNRTQTSISREFFVIFSHCKYPYAFCTSQLVDCSYYYSLLLLFILLLRQTPSKTIGKVIRIIEAVSINVSVKPWRLAETIERNFIVHPIEQRMMVLIIKSSNVRGESRCNINYYSPLLVEPIHWQFFLERIVEKWKKVTIWEHGTPRRPASLFAQILVKIPLQTR